MWSGIPWVISGSHEWNGDNLKEKKKGKKKLFK